jgi:phosphoglycolate phosphatase
MRKLVIFDIDGTLLLTGGAGKAAFDRVFAKLYGIKGAWRDIHPDGRTDPSLIRELFEKNLGRRPRPEEEMQVTLAYAAAMAEEVPRSERFRLLPGVLQLLEILQQRGLALLGLATGNFESTAGHKLRHAKLDHFFHFGGYGSDHAERPELTKVAVERGLQRLGRRVSPEEILLVGDTVHDVDCGRRLGLTTVAVATGSTSRKVLEAARADFVVDSFGCLEEILPIFEG